VGELMANPLLSRKAQMFPTLTPAQIDRIALQGQRRRMKVDQSLFEVGDRDTPFYVSIDAEMEILRPDAQGEDRVVLHGPGEFTGEINMLSGRRALVRGRIAREGEVVVLDREHLRDLVQRDSELSEILMRAFILRRAGLISEGGEMVLIGSRHSAGTMQLREFLTRNAHPFTYQELETEPGVQEFLDRFHVGVNEIPLVVCRGGKLLRNPSIDLLAEHLGLSSDLRGEVTRDVVIVGAGPAGLAAAVYAASEGLNVLVLESTAPGGQAGTSSRIENYLGFPTGISGQALAGRAFTQAEKFGADIAIARRVVRLDCDSQPYQLFLDNGEVVRTRAIIIATGARYRKPDLPELSRFEGLGVFYAATHLEAQLCKEEEVAVVGGGNSAGQAAVFLSEIAKHVHVLVRGEGLADSMSRYLIHRVTTTPNITLRTRTRIEALEGKDGLESIRCRQIETDSVQSFPVRHLFLMTGADPHTDWLQGCVQLDDKGFIKTGVDLTRDDVNGHWKRVARPPFLLETSIPGVFAVGDARSGNVKRVASAVGEGSICVQLVHRALQEL
jgi:thioredoxin reductase (NADPH)